MGHQQSQEISRFKTNHHLASVIRPPTSPSAAYSIGNALPSQKGEAAISDFRFCCDTLNHRTAESQARERCNNAGRVIGQLSEANRALYPTRVHYFVMCRVSRPSRSLNRGRNACLVLCIRAIHLTVAQSLLAVQSKVRFCFRNYGDPLTSINSTKELILSTLARL